MEDLTNENNLEKWWEDKTKCPKGQEVKERIFENGKLKLIITYDCFKDKWTSYKIENGELQKYKSGKSPMDVV